MREIKCEIQKNKRASTPHVMILTFDLWPWKPV